MLTVVFWPSGGNTYRFMPALIFCHWFQTTPGLIHLERRGGSLRDQCCLKDQWMGVSGMMDDEGVLKVKSGEGWGMGFGS